MGDFTGDPLPKNKDEELLERFTILRTDRHKEKLVRFKVEKNEMYQQLVALHHSYLKALKDAGCSLGEIVNSLMKKIESLDNDLSRYIVLSHLLNDEAVDNARLALSLREPSQPKKQVNLKIVKS